MANFNNSDNFSLLFSRRQTVTIKSGSTEVGRTGDTVTAIYCPIAA